MNVESLYNIDTVTNHGMGQTIFVSLPLYRSHFRKIKFQTYTCGDTLDTQKKNFLISYNNNQQAKQYFGRPKCAFLTNLQTPHRLSKKKSFQNYVWFMLYIHTQTHISYEQPVVDATIISFFFLGLIRCYYNSIFKCVFNRHY